MKVAIAQSNPTIGDINGNIDKMIGMIDKSRAAGAELVVFPEMATIGYPPKDLLLNSDFIEALNDLTERLLLPVSHDIGILFGTVTYDNISGMLCNSALLAYNGDIISRQDKSLLPTYDVFDEARYFIPADTRQCMQFGDLKLGVSICEDIWNDKDFWDRPRYPLDVIAELALQQPDMFINISASPYHYGKFALRSDMIKNIAKKYHTPIIYANQVGANDELIFDGGSFCIDALGNRALQAKVFDEDIITIDSQKLMQGTYSSYDPNEDIAWMHDALVLGIRDYFHKTGCKKTVVALSGGIDSAVVCALAVDALGKRNVLGLSMPSRYSSTGSRDDAYVLAKNLDIEFRTYPIEDVFEACLRTFNGDSPPKGDLAEENIQARIRGNFIMFIANRENRMALTTGNKSELAVGYCTLYGDMCGALAPISDVPKTMVYELARYINREYEIIPESTIAKAPSAELRPDQKDEDSLPPYSVLDPILHAYIEENKSFAQIVAMGYEPDLVKDIIHKVDRAEFKRRQAAPGLKVTTKAFGIGRRMPIAQRWTGSII
ncbi:NAD+ synthase [Mahella australiensis]|uniref:Glutamine-dependent NAD(+) synthetase n=1 Tax=Mahella australiensis (strain DSM 15567 / CIP 107919 / 50-1 BON) TaxID=697281 RepID=F3ZYR8_MAHA5|nr:NAD+ synthase [Mahella australiensis]AEE95663.1 NAD+ synthetase [Mahella australiensis 50-1 BON]